MKVISLLKSCNNKNLLSEHVLCNINIAEEYNIETGLSQDSFVIDGGFADNNSVIKQLSTNGLVLLDNRVTVWEEADFCIDVAGDSILMEFMLNGDPVPDDLTGKRPYSAIGLHNLRFTNKLNKVYRLNRNTTLDSFHILLSKNYYYKLIGKTSKVQNELADHIENNVSFELSENYFPMTFDIAGIINEVRSCTRTGSFHRLCLEIKILQLLLLQFEQYHNMIVHLPSKQNLHPDDVEKIKLAKNILDDSYNNPPTIKQLSQLVGVNESKLKAGFKTMFNTTIHSYVLKLRMDKANQLVKAQNLQVQEVAMELGYKNPSHFSAAFKKHFGFLPTEMI
ncbi:MAG: helix-turn-helix transcriptional regulator [Chitinophagaceae bacterium]|nr:helix-turn-helix transcriptional regulator [Chitinophagaceae bacterium]